MTAEQYDQVSAQLDEENNPPEGMLVHCAGEHEERFVQERLIPAQKAAMGEEAYAQMPSADRVEAPIHNLLIPGS